MQAVRVVFMGTPDFAHFHLESLCNDPQFHVVGVVSQPDRKQGRKMKLTASPVKNLALEKNIKVLTPEKFNDEEVYTTLQSWNPDVIVVVAYGQIISSRFLKIFDQKVVNIHGSLLPRWRGAAPIQRAIMAGDTTTGVSLQVMKKELDAGDVIGERKMSLPVNIDALELHDRLKVLGADLLKIELIHYLQGEIKPVPQDEKLVTYASKLSKAESKIDWSKPAKEVHDLVRGMILGPGTYSYFHQKKYKIWLTEVVDKSCDQPGTVLSENEEELVIGCGHGALKILSIQPESRSRMSIVDFLKGHPIKSGEVFGE